MVANRPPADCLAACCQARYLLSVLLFNFLHACFRTGQAAGWDSWATRCRRTIPGRAPFMARSGDQVMDIEAEHVAARKAKRRRTANEVAVSEIELDDSHYYVESSAKSVCEHASHERPGPHNLEEVLSCRFAVAAVDQHARQAGVDLRRKSPSTLGQVTYITTSYSGIGTAEAAVAEVARQLSLTGSAVNFKMHGAVERDPRCLEALQLHRSCSKSTHIFNDVTDRIPRQVATRLQQRAATLRRRVAELVDRARQQHGKEAADKARAHHVSELGAQFLDHAKKELGKLDWQTCNTSWCLLHRRECSLKPAAGPRDTWIEIAGSTCVAWSTMGAGWGWLDSSTVPCLTWAFWASNASPDCVIHENVRPFDWGFFRDPEIFGERYWVASYCHSPVDQGVPASRPRRYTVLLSRALALQAQNIPRGVILPDISQGVTNPLRST